MAPAGSARGCPGTMLAVEGAEVLQGHRGSGARPGHVPAAGGSWGPGTAPLPTALLPAQPCRRRGSGSQRQLRV